MISDLEYILETIAMTKQLRRDWESIYYEQLDLIGHNGWASERDNDSLNQAQEEIASANERIRMLEGALAAELGDSVETFSPFAEH